VLFYYTTTAVLHSIMSDGKLIMYWKLVKVVLVVYFKVLYVGTCLEALRKKPQ
jgi:hypothetical protein